jgi:hypothetical protein
MKLQERYLHFDNLDMQQPVVSSQCSECGLRFTATPKPEEHIDELLLRVRAEYEAHVCES